MIRTAAMPIAMNASTGTDPMAAPLLPFSTIPATS
jgi:hypothetical protein